MKKLIALILSALMLTAVLAGCGSSGRSIADIKAAGTLSIATSPDFPPFESLGEGNAVEGIEIDILNEICSRLGVTLTINQMDFDSVIPGINAGKYDVGVSGITAGHRRDGRQPDRLQGRPRRQIRLRPDRHHRRGILHGRRLYRQRVCREQ